MSKKDRLTIKVIPIYSSNGDAEVFLRYPYLYNRMGEWIGWVSVDNEVYSVMGLYVGYISKDRRILSKMFYSNSRSRRKPPPAPPKFRPPATTPLAPLFSELLTGTVDILLENPEKLHTTDSGELKPDMD